ncbi:hypothetical protein ACMGDH_09350 [Sphingomonas sp. DT-207]|uniref:hypothetical protein n=1 Tax=Sphingomonas sp. DT-207 TaxID=3396167 RepID=UPI003F1D88A9
MLAPAQVRPASRIACLVLALAIAATPETAIAAPKARLVHCGDATCLRISGRRAHAAVTIRIAGRPLMVEGNRSWRATVPLATARGWAGAHSDALTVTLADTRTGGESTEVVALPPGALGKRIELSSLIVSAY